MTASATLVSEAMFFSTGEPLAIRVVPAPGRYTINTGIAYRMQTRTLEHGKYISALDGSSSATNLFVLNGMGEQNHPCGHGVGQQHGRSFPSGPKRARVYAKLVSAVKDIRTVENRSIYVDLAVFSN